MLRSPVRNETTAAAEPLPLVEEDTDELPPEPAEPLDLGGSEGEGGPAPMFSRESWHGVALYGGLLLLVGLATAYLLPSSTSPVILFLLGFFLSWGFLIGGVRGFDAVAIAFLAAAFTTLAIGVVLLASVPLQPLSWTVPPSSSGSAVVLACLAAGLTLLVVGLAEAFRVRYDDD